MHDRRVHDRRDGSPPHPTQATDSVTFESAYSTILLAHVSVGVGRQDSDTARAAIVCTIAGTGEPPTVTLRHAPNRCDAHAIAGDKRAIIYTVTIPATDGPSGSPYLGTVDDARKTPYHFVRATCSLPTG